MSYRLSKDTIARFTSMEELREAWQLKPLPTKKPNNAKRLKKVQDDFKAHHKCRACGKPMEWIPNTNIFVCKNEKCNGIKQEYIDKETGETKIRYIVPNDLLNPHYEEIATTIFSE